MIPALIGLGMVTAHVIIVTTGLYLIGVIADLLRLERYFHGSRPPGRTHDV